MRKTGNVQGFKVTKVHPVEGTTMEVSFTSEIKGSGKFPSGRNIGSGIMTLYPHGAEEACNTRRGGGRRRARSLRRRNQSEVLCYFLNSSNMY